MLRGLLCAWALGLGAVSHAAPIAVADEPCRLQKIVIDIGLADETASPPRAAAATAADALRRRGANETESRNTVWLCCRLGDDEDDCRVLFGAATNALSDADAGAVVSLNARAGATLLGRLGADVAELSPIARMSFGDTPAVEPLSFETRGGRKLQEASGAAYVDRTAFWGSRSVLIAIVGKQVTTNGQTATWPKPCSIYNMRKLMFGAFGGVPITVERTPWSALEGCRTGKTPCKYNVRDQARAISRGAVDIDPVKSRFVFLPQVNGWPENFCNYAAINGAVKTALKRVAPGLKPEAFNHLIMITPKHCALGQGQQPGRSLIASTCPESGAREDLGSIVMHEFGHNLGFGHSGTATANGAQIGTYSDGTSEMGSSKGSRPSTVNLAHRHMFRWLPGLPESLYSNGNRQRGVVQTELRLCDPGTQARLADGAKWGAKIDDGSKSWYVGYRSCDGIDSDSKDELCGFVQVSLREGTDPSSKFVASVKAAGQSATFGQGVRVTVTALQNMPAMLRTGTVRVRIRVERS